MKKLLVLLLVLATAALTITACVNPPATDVKTEVTLDAQGGTLESTTLTATKGEAYTLPTPTKAGYTFDGWYLGETKIEATGTWTYEDTELVLVAKWTAKTTAITLEGIENPVNVTYGASYTLPAATKTGYNFDGWYNGDTKVESTGTWANDVAALTLTAKWTAKTTVITLEGIDTPVNATYDAAYELPAADKTGYTFDGWVDADGNAVALTGTWANEAAAVTLTAKWIAKTTVITLEGIDTPVNATFDAAYELPTPTKVGSTFAGWFDADGNQVALTGTWTTDVAAITLTAKWSQAVTTVTLVNGDKTETKLFTYGDAYVLDALTKTGYTFDGWFDADGNAVALTGTWENEAATVTYTAKWTAKKTTVTVQNGDKTETVELTFDAAYDLTTPELAGYTFDGWFIGDKKLDTAGTWAIEDATVTVVAKWTAKKTTVTLDAKGGAVEGETTLTLTYGEAYTLPTPTKAGEDFLGWKANGKSIALTGTWTLEDAELTLEATWGTATTPDDNPGEPSDPEVEDNIDKDGWT